MNFYVNLTRNEHAEIRVKEKPLNGNYGSYSNWIPDAIITVDCYRGAQTRFDTQNKELTFQVRPVLNPTDEATLTYTIPAHSGVVFDTVLLPSTGKSCPGMIFASTCPAGGQVQWKRYDAPGGNLLDQAILDALPFSQTAVGQYYYTVECVNTPCPGPAIPFTFTINPAPTAFTLHQDGGTATDLSSCYGGRIGLRADGCVGTVRWYQESTNTQVFEGAVFATNPLYGSINYQATCTTGSGTIPSVNRIQVTVIPQAAPTTPTFNGGTVANMCEGSPMVFASTCPSGGQVEWKRYDAPGGNFTGGYARQDQLPFTGVPAGIYYHTVECINSTCPAPAIPFSFTVNAKPAKPTAISASPATINDPTNVTLTASGCAGTLRWEYANGSPLVGNVVSVSATTTFGVRCQSAQGCLSDTASVTVRFTSHQYQGNYDGIYCTTVNGWMVDLNQDDQPQQVRIFIDGNEIETVPTTLVRPDVRDHINTYSHLTGTFNVFGFSWTIPTQYRGTNKTITVKTLDGVVFGTQTLDLTPPVVTLTPTTSQVCDGQPVTLTASATGGNGYVYAFSGGVAAGYQTVVNTSGAYTVKVTAANGCTAVSAPASVIIATKPAKPSMASASPAAFKTPASVTLTANGCAGTLRWEYANGSLIAGNVVSVSATTTFGVRCQNGQGCLSDTASVTVQRLNLPSPVISQQPARPLFCGPANLTLTTSNCPVGSTPKWWNGSTGQTLIITLDKTTDIWAVCAQSGLESDRSQTITITVQPVATLVTSDSNGQSGTVATGQSLSLTTGQTLSLTAVAAYNPGIVWYGPNDFRSAGSILERIGVTAGLAGQYTAVATYTSSGCSTSAVVNVIIDGPGSDGPGLTAAPLSAAGYCAGSTLSASFSTTGSFGSGNQFTLQLSDAGGNFTTPVAIGTGTGSPITATIPAGLPTSNGYRVRIVSTNPVLSASSPTVLTINTNPVSSITGTLTLCTGQSTVLTASGGSSYLWSTGATTATASVTAAGVYSVTATTTGSCPALTSVTVVSADRVADGLLSPSAGLNYSYYQQAFANNDVEGMTGVTPTAQGTAATFSLDAQANHPGDNYGYEFTGYVQVSTAGQYTFFTNSDDGSRLWIGNQLVVDNNGTHGSQTQSGQLCLGVGYHAIRVRYIQGYGGANLSVSWQGPGFGQQEIPATRVFHSGCSVPSIAGNLVVCSGQSTVLTAGGGSAYQWSTGATTPAISVSTTGTYSVTATNGAGCFASTSVTVMAGSLPGAVSIGASPGLTLCTGQSTVLTASGGSSYLWSTGATTATASVTAAGVYSVTATTTGSCPALTSVTVVSADRVADGLSSPVAGLNYSYYQQAFANNDVEGMTGVTPTAQGTVATFSLDAQANHPGDNYGYEFTGYVQVSTAGQYTFFTNSDDGSRLWIGNQLVVDNNGGHASQTASGQLCLGVGYHAIRVRYTQGLYGANLNVSWQGPGMGQQEIPANRLFRTDCPSPSIAGNLVICSGQSTVLSVNVGSTYRWSTGATTPAISVSTTGPLSVTVTNAAGCSAVATAVVTSGNLPATITIGGTLTLCTGQSTVLTANGGSSYLWNTGATTATISVTAAGVYSVTAVSGTSCPAAASTTVVASDRIADGLLSPVAGLNYSYYQQTFSNNDVEGMTGVTPTAQGTVATFSLDAQANHPGDNYGYEFTGYVQVSTAGQYTFFTNSDDGSRLWIGNQLVVDNNGTHGSQTQSGQLCLGVGYHAIRVRYIQGYGGANLSVSWQGPGMGQPQEIPANRLVHSGSFVASIDGNLTICPGQSTTLTASGGSTYLWSTGEQSTTVVVAPASTSTYSVVVTNASGTTAVASTSVVVSAVPSLTITGKENLCAGESTTLRVSGGTNYLWSTSEFADSIVVTPTQSTTYSVWSAGETGCIAEASKLVTTTSFTLTTGSSYSPPGRTTANQIPTDGQGLTSGSMIQLSATIQSDQPETVTYTWSGPNSFTSNQKSPTFLYQSPDQLGTYEVIASTSSGCVSGGRIGVGTEPQCDLTINAIDPTTYEYVPVGETWLTASGCSGGTALWSNGSNQLDIYSDTPSSITWADGETANISYGGLGQAILMVKPSKQTIYTVICKVGSGSTQKTCTYSVGVKVSSPDCQNLQISASATTFERGDLITLTATNCAGKLTWSNGLGNANSVKISPTTDLIVSAICSDGAKTCYSNAITIKARSCIKALFVSTVSLSNNKHVVIGYSGCETGQVSWTVVKGAYSNKTVQGQFCTLEGVGGNVTVSATCYQAGGPPCPPATLDLTPELTKCKGDKNYYLTITDPGVIPANMMGIGSLYSFILKDESNTSYNTTPQHPVYVPIFQKEKLYTATFEDGCVASMKVLSSIIKPEIDWKESVLIGNKSRQTGRLVGSQVLFSTVIDEFYLSTYSAYNQDYWLDMMLKTTCPGEVVWTVRPDSDGSFNTSKLLLRTSFSAPNAPPQYRLFPFETTTYQAACRVTNPDGSVIVYPAINTKRLVITSNDCIRITNLKPAIPKGELVQLKADGCLGTVSWSLAGVALGSGSTLMHTPLPATTPNVVKYQATCSNPACSQEVSVTVTACSVRVTASKQTVKIGEPVQLTATGCSGGTVQWNTGDVGAMITVGPMENTTYKADCVVSGTILCTNSILLTVDNKPAVAISTPQLALVASPCSVERCSATEVIITPSGCENGTISWDGGASLPANKEYKVTLGGQKLITAICTNQYGISTKAQIDIKQDEPELQVSYPEKVYAGYPITLYASGCVLSNCQAGNYQWTNLQTGQQFSGPRPKITLIQTTSFKLSCNGVEKPFSVTIAQPECNPEFFNPGNSFGSHTLTAPAANTDYAIRWYRTGHNGSIVNELVAENVKTVKIPAFSCVNAFDSDQYKCTFVTSSSAPCEANYNIACTSGGTVGGTGGQSGPTNPNECTQWAFDAKRRVTKYEDRIYVTAWCPGRLVELFEDPGRTAAKLVASLVPPAEKNLGKSTTTQTYYDRCWLNDKDYCDGTATFKVKGSGRLDAETCSPSSSTTSLPNTIALSNALGGYLSPMICQISELFKDKDGQFSRALAGDYLNRLTTELQNALPGVTLIFPTNLNPVIDALQAGNCQLAGQLLAASMPGTIAVSDYDSDIRPTYNTVLAALTQCEAQPAPTSVEEATTSGGRVAAQDIDYNRLYIAPDGRAVRLPNGAIPKFFNFGGPWGIPPIGTLQGYVLPNGETYFAEIFGRFVGYRLAKVPLCPAKYGDPIYVSMSASQTANVYYFEEYKDAVTGKCGYNWIEASYTFQPDPTGGLIDIIPALSGPHTISTAFQACRETSNYITKGFVNSYSLTAALTTSEETQLKSLLAAINGTLGLGTSGSGEGSITVIDINKLKLDALKREMQVKGVQEYIPPTGRIQYKNKYVLIFFGGGQGFGQCEFDFINSHMTAIQANSFFLNDYTNVDGWLKNFIELGTQDARQSLIDKVKSGQPLDGLSPAPRSDFSKTLMSTAAFYYYAAFATLRCTFDENKFYVQNGLKPDGSVQYRWNQGGAENCGKAFAAGAIHSVIEDIDVITMAQGLSELLKSTLAGGAKPWLDYPGNVRAFQDKLTTSPQALTGDDLVKILPPSVQNNQQLITQAANMGQFLYKNYYTDANCWRSGELTAQVLPIVLTAGALAATKVAPLMSKTAGRLHRLSIRVGADKLVGRFLQDGVEYVKIGRSAGADIEQAIVRDADGNLENIYEEVDDLNLSPVKICGACLAQTTPVYGTGQTLQDLSQQQPVPTLEADGRTGWRQVVGKISRRVSEYVSVWVQGERLDASTDHEFRTEKGWAPANALRKGMLVLSLATNSLLPIDSVAYVTQPLWVEGLSVGTAQGYGVGQWGVVVAGSRNCFIGFTEAHYAGIERALTDAADQVKFYNEIGKYTADDFKALFKYADDAEKVARNWKLLDGSPIIRQEAGNLINFQKAIDLKPANLTVEQLAAKINASDSKADLLDGLTTATSDDDFTKLLAGSKPFDVPFPGFITPYAYLAIDDITDGGLKGEMLYLKEQRKTAPNANVKGDYSELLGEKAADGYAKKQGWGNQLCAECTGLQGEFDRIYQDANGNIRIVEAKGGSSSLGGRNTAAGYAQQGTQEYFASILQAMTTSSNPQVRATATIIANTPSSKIEYWLIRQDFDSADNFKDISANKFF